MGINNVNQEIYRNCISVETRVMSYNIQHGRGIDGIQDLQRIRDVIRQSEAELVGLQEVDKHNPDRSHNVDQAQWLANELNMHCVYAANLDQEPAAGQDQRWQYGVAILSKYPVTESHHYFLSSFGDEQRGLLEAIIEIQGVPVHFYTTHLGLTAEQREVQVREIIDIAKKASGPKIIVGDFNAEPSSAEMDLFSTEYSDAFSGKPHVETIPSNNPTRRIDYIFASAIQTEFISSNVMNTQASDHLPIVSNIAIMR